MTSIRHILVGGHRIQSDPDHGWRCSCAAWEPDGSGCVHTAQVAALDTLEGEAARLLARGRLSRHPSTPSGRVETADAFRAIEGTITRLVAARGLIDFEIGQRWFTLVGARARSARTLQVGQHVQLIFRAAPLNGYHDVLAIRREGEPAARYTGILPRRSIVVAGTLACVAALSGIPWLMACAATALLVACPFVALAWLQRVRVMRIFAAEEWAKSSSPIGAPSSSEATRESPLDVPLTLGPPPVMRGSESWPTEILEFTHDAIIVWEMDGGGVRYWNRAAENLYGFTREEAYGRVTHELLRTQLAGGVQELEAKLARYGIWVGELRHTTKNGNLVEVEARLSLMPQEGRPWLVLEINRDVTDRNRAEEARERMELQLRRMRKQSHTRLAPTRSGV